MEDRQPTTKSILENYSGNILDIPNGKEKILDRFKNYPQRLKDSSNQKLHHHVLQQDHLCQCTV